MHHFNDLAERAARACLDYALARLRYDPVDLDRPLPLEELQKQVGRTITREGKPPEDVLRLFVEKLAPACISTDHPKFFAFIPAAPTKASLVFDTVVAVSSINAASWLEAAGAVYAENEALRYLADAAGLPEHAGGCFVSGGSAGNLSALAVARETARAQRGMPDGHWQVAVGEQSHSSVASALRLLDIEPLLVPSDEHDRMTGDHVAETLEDASADRVCAVVATAGTTNAGIVDDLDSVSRIAQRYGLWLHVDAAYGGAALLAPSARHLFAGIERADSVVIDPHKWLFAPFDCAALLYRDPTLARAVHAQQASYLEPIRTGDEWNPADYAYHLSRRARGLPFWYSLAVHGTDAYSAAIEGTLALTRLAAEHVRAAPHLELVREPHLSVLLFRRRGWPDGAYTAWSRRLLDEQIAFALPTTWKGEVVGRAVFLHPNTTIVMVDELFETMR